MRQTELNDFDLQVRSMMENAEVKAPSRVWRAVSSRIASETPAAASWLRWAVPALAAAAAVAAVIFLPGKGIDTIPQTGEMVAQLAEPVQTAPVAATPVVEEAPAAEEAAPVLIAALPKKASPFTVETPAVASAAPSSEPAHADLPTKLNTASTDVIDSEATPEYSTPATTVPDADPFALMAYEDEKASGRTVMSVVADGMIGGNDAGRIYRHRGYGASGEGSSSSVVTENSESTYGIPVSFGLGARFHLTDRFSLGAGVNYTLLSRSFRGSYLTYTGDVSNVQQYIGVPVNLYYDFFNTDVFRFYTFAGGTAEYCLSNKFTLRDVPAVDSFASVATPSTIIEPAKGLQFSAGLGLGVEFKITRNIGIYVDPAVRYYFKSNQPKSIRTEHPLMLNFEAGVKFDIGNR